MNSTKQLHNIYTKQCESLIFIYDCVFVVRFSPLMMLCVLTKGQEYQTVIRTCSLYISFLSTVLSFYLSTYSKGLEQLSNPTPSGSRHIHSHRHGQDGVSSESGFSFP